MPRTENQTVHDWSTGKLVIYQIEVIVEDEETSEPPSQDPPSTE